FELAARLVGISSKSLRLRAGSMIRFTPARAAAATFSSIPPAGSTRPRRLISPVIAVSMRITRPDFDSELLGAALNERESGRRALAHHLAEVPGQDQPAAAGRLR